MDESVRITNYKDKEFKIVKAGKDSTTETMYIMDGKQYRTNDSEIYEVNDITAYTNPSVYLEGLLNAYDINKPKEEKIGNEKYSLYKITIKKSVFKQILKDTILDDFTVNFDVNGKIYIDKNGYVNRIIYNLYGITIDATYYSINDVKEIHMSYRNSHQKS
jgi:hypothetical protein